MKKTISLLLCMLMLSGILVMPVSALSYYVSHYEEAIYAGGVVDLYAYPSVGDPEDYTYQWQYDAGIGAGHWYDVEENGNYSGAKTNHLKLHTSTGSYDGWEEIPFQCVVTSSDGTVRHTANIYMHIYPTSKLIPNMKNWGYGLYTPSITNATDLHTTDDVNYTASACAGAKLRILCGSKPVDDEPILRKSEVALTTETYITENGKTTTGGNSTLYIPYAVGRMQVQIKEKLTIGGHDLGYFDTKTIDITVTKPQAIDTGTAKSDCSLLRYTYNESQKLASIPKGASLEIVGEEGSYYQVYYNGYVGYVGKALLNASDTAAGKLITNVDVTIQKPAAGEKPSFACSILTEGCQLYKTEPVTWYDATAKKYLSSADKFTEGHSYDLTIWLAAKSGYKFRVDSANKPKLTGSINGNLPPFINKAYEQDPEEVVELFYTFNNVKPKEPEQTHTCAPVLEERVEPTCTQAGHEAYYRCSCGMCYTDAQGQNAVNIQTWGILPATGHAPSPWRTTGAYHYKVCSTCGEFLEQEDHKGGSATCAAKGVCSACGYAYLPENENHAPESKWTACGNLYHAHLCKLCGAHCDPQDHVPGPAATGTTPQTCTVCGYVITPAMGHIHKLTAVEGKDPTCTETGIKAHYSCVGCGRLYEDDKGQKEITAAAVTIAPLEHTMAEFWSWDEQQHWKCCAICGIVMEETKALHEDANGVCGVCAFVTSTAATTEATVPAGTAPQETTSKPTQAVATSPAGEKETAETTQPPASASVVQQTPSEGVRPGSEKQNGLLSVLLVALVCFGTAVITTVIFLKHRSKGGTR